jgi:16S rRNA C967 or C1407 C5-methylase (RsmB/RsmF family)
MTPFLWEALLQAYGAESAEKVADALQSEAPVTIRANLLKTTQQALYEQLSPRFPSLKKLSSPAALTFGKREPLFSLPEFKEGLFEVQDEGSQQVAELMAVAPGDQVVDYCSGSGGKTLAFAPKMGGKGQIYLHDIRLSALAQAKKRLRRAGVQNGQCLPSDHPKWRQLEEKVDWILVDAPCSGSGTLRRNPEMKFFIDSSLVARLVQEQRSIFDQAIRLLKPGGKLVYATCSLLPAENGEQLSWFLDRYPIALERPPLAILPEIGGPDAFFAAVVVKTASMLGYSRI